MLIYLKLRGFFSFTNYILFLSFSSHISNIFPLYLWMQWVSGIWNLLTHIFIMNWTTYQHETILSSHAYCLQFSHMTIVKLYFWEEGIYLIFDLGLSLLINYHWILKIYSEILYILIGKVNPFINIIILILSLISYFNYSLQTSLLFFLIFLPIQTIIYLLLCSTVL